MRGVGLRRSTLAKGEEAMVAAPAPESNEGEDAQSMFQSGPGMRAANVLPTATRATRPSLHWSFPTGLMTIQLQWKLLHGGFHALLAQLSQS